MPTFDIVQTQRDGYSSKDILDYLAPNTTFDIASARSDGRTDDEILGYLGGLDNPFTKPKPPKLGPPSWAPERVIPAAVETVVSLATGVLAWPMSKITEAIGTAVYGGNEGARMGQRAAEMFTYQPSTDMGKASAGLAGAALSLPFYPAEKLKQYVSENVSPEVGQAVGTAAEGLTMAAMSFLPRLRGLVKTKSEAFDLAKTMDTSLQDIPDPKMRKEFVDFVIDKAELTKQDPWATLEEAQTKYLPVVKHGEALAVIPDRYAVTPDGKVIIPAKETPVAGMSQREINLARREQQRLLETEISGESYVKGEKAYPALQELEKTTLPGEGIRIGQVPGEMIHDISIKFTTDVERARFNDLLQTPGFLWDASDKAFYNRMLEGTKNAKLFPEADIRVTPDNFTIEPSYRVRTPEQQRYMGLEGTSNSLWTAEDRAFMNRYAEENQKQGQRTLKSFLGDLNNALGERGSTSGERTPEQQAAIDRLGADLDTLKARAREAGVSLEQYLRNEGIDPKVAALVSNHSNPININVPQTASGVEQMFKNQRQANKDRVKTTLKDVREWVVRSLVDVSGNVKRELRDLGPLGEEAAMRRDLVGGASGKAGEIIEKAHREITGGLSRKEMELLADAIQARRTIEIDSYKEGVAHPEGYGGEAHTKWLFDVGIIRTISARRVAEVNKRVNIYFDLLKDQLNQLKDAGIINQKDFDILSQHVYSPRKYIQHLDPDRVMDISGKKINVTESGIKTLDEGSLGYLENNPELLLAEVVSRTQGRIFMNEANKALLQIATDTPNNGLVSLTLSDKKPTLIAWQNGDKYTFSMEPNYAKEWVTSDPLLDATLGNIIGWLSGGKVLRAAATGYNPAFAISNMPRDIAQVWASSEGKKAGYSAELATYLGQMTHDLMTVLPDVLSRKGRVIDFANEGGEMPFLTHYGRFRGQGYLTERVNSLTEIMGWLGETSELWTRLALRERALRNGKSAKEATYLARAYMDFSLGGNITKTIDKGIPYLNAGVQGTRTIFRNAKENPGRFLFQMGELGTIATGLYLNNMMMAPKTMSEVTPREKEANFIIAMPDTFRWIDDKGQERGLYFKIAKNQGQRLVTSIFEGLMERYYEGKFPSEQMWMGFNDLVNIVPTENLPPTVSALVGYLLNKDLWTREDIWKGPKVRAGEEYDIRRTNPMFVAAGKVGLSPERTAYAVNRIAPLSNPFSGMVTGGMSAILGSLPEEIRQKTVTQLMTENPSIRRIFASTNPYEPYKEGIEQLKIDENTRRFMQRRDFDAMLEKHFRIPTEQSAGEIKAFIIKQPEEDRDRLIGRVLKTKQYLALPDRTWWINMSELPPESRAAVFWSRYSVASEKDKKGLLTTAANLDGIMSDRFVDKLTELVKTGRVSEEPTQEAP